MTQRIRAIAAQLLLTAALGLFGCGDDPNAPVTGCGECPQDHYCTNGPDGLFCQSPYSRSQEDAPGGAHDMFVVDQPEGEQELGNDDQNDGLFHGRDFEDGAEDENPAPAVEGCNDVQLRLKPSSGSIPRVMLVVDRSYSMVVEEDRWSPIQNTISRVTRNLGDTVYFGLTLFPSPEPGFRGSEAEMACAPGDVNVGTGSNTSANINQWLNQHPPQQGLATPTHSALEAAGRHLLQAPTGNDYILLATDGGPGCNFGLDHHFCTCLNHACPLGLPEMCLDDQRTVSKVQDLAASGIKTIVLGIASDEFMPESRAVLDRMAVAGETALEGRHFEVNRVDDLERNLTAAAGNLAPCRYDLGELAQFEEFLTISIDDQAIARDAGQQNGWDFDNGAVEFFGAACQTLRDGLPHQISASCN